MRALNFAIGGALILMSFFYILGAVLYNQPESMLIGVPIAFVGFFLVGQALFEEEIISNE